MIMANTCLTIYIEPHNYIINEFLLVSRLSRAVPFAIIKFIFGGTCGILVVGFPGSLLQIMPKGTPSKLLWILKNARAFFGRRTVQTYHQGSRRSSRSRHSTMRSYRKSEGFLQKFEVYIFFYRRQLLSKV